MKNLLLKVLTGTILVSFLVFCYNTDANAAQFTKTLDEDTKITPPGVTATVWGFIPEFKKGTTVILNDNGEVLEGTLTSYENLPYVAGVFYPRGSYGSYVPNMVLMFKPGTRVIFNNKGEVIKGTVERSVIPVGQWSAVMVKDGTEVSFHDNGMLATFTPGENTYLRPIGWQQNLTAGYTNKVKCPGFVEFKGTTQVELNDKGEVVIGTLNKDTKLLSPDGNIKVYEANTTVEFADKGVVVKASK